MSKSWRTNIVALAGAIILVVGLILAIIDKDTFSEVIISAGVLALILQVISSYLVKDAKATHSESQRTLGGDSVPPEEEEEPSAGK